MNTAQIRLEPRAKGVWIPVIVFAVAMLVRVPALLEARSDIVFNNPIMDGASYHAWACRISEGHVLGSGVFYQEPLYAYIIGGIYALVGQSFFRAAMVQVLVDGFNCVLLYFVGARLFGREVGLLAGLILAFFGQAVFHALMPAKETWAVLFLLLAILGSLKALEASRAHRRKGLIWWFASGLALSALILLRGNALLVVPLLAAWMWLAMAEATRVRRVAMLGIWLAGVALIPAAVSVRNYAVGGQFVLTSAHSGFNYYIGNGPAADGTYKPVEGVREDPAYEGSDAREVASALNGKPLTMAQTLSYFWNWTIRYDLAHPGQWARLLGLKFLRFFNGAEVSDTWTIGLWRERIPLLGLAWAPFWILIGPALLGLVVAAGRGRQHWILHAVLFGALAGTVLFYLVSRYRLPFVPVFILLASAGAVWLVEQVKSGSWRQAASGAGVVALGTVLAVAPLPGTSAADYRANDMINLAEIRAKSGDIEQASEDCQRAVALAPDYSRAYAMKGAVELLAAKRLEAEDDLRRAIRLDDRNAQAHYFLGMCLNVKGDNAGALAQWRLAVDCQPGLAEAWRDMGLVHLQRQEVVEAAECLGRAYRLGPDDRRTLLALASLCYAMGKTDKARDCWTRVTIVAPGSPESAIAAKNLEKYFGHETRGGN